MEATQAARRGAQARSSGCWSLQGLWSLWSLQGLESSGAASASTCLGPVSPLSPVVLGTELSQGCLSLAHFFKRGFSLHTGQAFFSLDSNRQQ